MGKAYEITKEEAKAIRQAMEKKRTKNTTKECWQWRLGEKARII